MAIAVQQERLELLPVGNCSDVKGREQDLHLAQQQSAGYTERFRVGCRDSRD